MIDIKVSGRLATNVADVWGDDGRAWLARLPELLEVLAARWNLQVYPPFEGLSFNYVAPVALAGGAPAVLKVGVPCEERATEIEALRLFDGRGACRLLAATVDLGAILMERMQPGQPLSDLTSYDDEAAVSAAAGLMHELWRPAPAVHPFPTVARWAAGFRRLRAMFGGTTGPLPETLVARAESLFQELDGSEPAHLLHGDLHPGNILSAERRPWLAIDPKGLVGGRGYDAGNFLRSDLPADADERIVLRRRIDQLAGALEFERSVLRDWAFAQAILSAWWSVEDHGAGWEPAIAIAAILADI